ncbi:MAG: ATP-binding cassette domain-containing protein [Gammaproteobacteria bacterium]|nr:ATP-binding cassette domain-containing protein [Gammaproteobacteria bacterium]
MLSFQNLQLSRGKKILLQQASVNIFPKQKIGLVGRNGCGKSSLFALILGHLQHDAGEFNSPGLDKISSLAQEINDSNLSAIDYVLSGDIIYTNLIRSLDSAKDTDIAKIHEQLDAIGGYAKPAMAATILSGLGFVQAQHQHTVSSFSGGWRMRLGLARCLMKPADIYLLDEPTNHLDLEAILWLERWLKQLPAMVLLISHDREFLDNTIDKILHIDAQELKLYSGNYSFFEKARAEALMMQQTQFEKQQKKIQHMMDFVRRFKAKATKAKQAQSRMKAIEKIDLIAQANIDSEFSFEFKSQSCEANPLLRCDDVSFGYIENKPTIRDIQFILHKEDRIGLLGPNGQGKSTFIKGLLGKLPFKTGYMHQASGLKVAYYAQHQMDDLDINLSPLQIIQELDSKAKEQDIRQFLGSFNFHADMALEPITYFSGGEKARLALAKLVWQKPNVLLLDEPTNHLDLEMRAAIELALQSYEGAMILISHDRHLLKTSVEEFYLVYDQQIQAFDGDIDDYYQWLSRDQAMMSKKNQPLKENQYKELKAIQNRIKKLEQLMQEAENKLAIIMTALGDESLYLSENANKLAQLQSDQKSIKQIIAAHETEWFECHKRLEDK